MIPEIIKSSASDIILHSILRQRPTFDVKCKSGHRWWWWFTSLILHPVIQNRKHVRQNLLIVGYFQIFVQPMEFLGKLVQIKTLRVEDLQVCEKNLVAAGITVNPVLKKVPSAVQIDLFPHLFNLKFLIKKKIQSTFSSYKILTFAELQFKRFLCNSTCGTLDTVWIDVTVAVLLMLLPGSGQIFRSIEETARKIFYLQDHPARKYELFDTYMHKIVS